MKVIFATALNNVEIEPIHSRGMEISDGLFLTTSFDPINPFFTWNVINSMGSLEYNHLKNSKAILYCIENLTNSENFEWFHYLNRRLAQTKVYLSCLWLVTDNAVDNELGFLTYTNNGEELLHSNFIASKFSRSDGSSSSLKLDLDAIKSSRLIYQTLRPNTTFGDPSKSRVVKGTARFDRGLYAIQAARTCSDMGERIAFYCTALESLFSTNNAELAHQLSERTAVFLSAIPERRLQIYRILKEAYGVRSKIVHGDTIKPSLNDKLHIISSQVDNIIRSCYITLFSDQLAWNSLASEGSELDDYMLGLIMGKHSCPNSPLNSDPA